MTEKLIERDSETGEYRYLQRILHFILICAETDEQQDYNSRKYKIRTESVIYQVLSQLMKLSSNNKKILLDIGINDIIQARSKYFTQLLNNNFTNDQKNFYDLCYGNEITESEVTRIKKVVKYINVDDLPIEIPIDGKTAKKNFAILLFDLTLRTMKNFLDFVQVLIENYAEADNEIRKNHGENNYYYEMFLLYIKKLQLKNKKIINYLVETIKI